MSATYTPEWSAGGGELVRVVVEDAEDGRCLAVPARSRSVEPIGKCVVGRRREADSFEDAMREAWNIVDLDLDEYELTVLEGLGFLP